MKLEETEYCRLDRRACPSGPVRRAPLLAMLRPRIARSGPFTVQVPQARAQ